MKKSDHQHKDHVEVKREDVLRLNFTDGDITSLNPQELALVARGLPLARLLFESLTRLHPDHGYELAGAAKVEISPCKKKGVDKRRPQLTIDSLS